MRTPLAWALVSVAGLSLAAVGGCGDDETKDGSGGNGAGDATTGGAGTGGGTGGTGAGGTGAGGNGGGGTQTAADCSPPEGDPGMLTLTEVASGISAPVLVTHAPGDDDRLFIVSQQGQIHLLKDGQTSLFLDVDIDDKVWFSNDERGLLGLAFHPDYGNNGRFFVHYTGQAGQFGTTVIQEFRRDPSNPDLADPAPVGSPILTVTQPAGNHNGGSIEFGPHDGFLYIALGDGGGSDDTFDNGQDKDTLLGALLRIDVDSGDPYGIPPGNITDGAPEIYDWGLRNPYRFSFDPCTGDRYIGDVGQNDWEEVDVAGANDPNKNWGWNVMEGMHCFNGGNCDMTGLTLPVAEYPNPTNGASSVAGGQVYRGSAIPWLRGTYFYADFYSGDVWTLRWADGNLLEGPTDISSDLYDGGGHATVSTFGRDNRGEIYLVSYSGSVYRIDPE